MYCKACGKQIDGDSVFCKFCGMSQVAGAQAPARPAEWITCLIELVSTRKPGLLSNYTCAFEAHRLEPSDRKTVKKSETFDTLPSLMETPRTPTYGRERRIAEILKQLTDALVSDGWEPVGHVGPSWYQYKFRRRAR